MTMEKRAMREKSNQSISPLKNDLLINIIVEIEIVYSTTQESFKKNRLHLQKEAQVRGILASIFKIRFLMVSI